MSSFQNYSAYYNLLYKDKDYRAESLYIHELIQAWNPGAKTILNLGCGTGKHDFLLAELGYEICAVDLSKTMIDIAQAENGHSNIEYHVGDVRNFEIVKSFDAVVSLFHVMSYQTTEEDLQAAFQTAKKHLSTGGIFIFDCWYGPGVESDPPKHVSKMVESEMIQVRRKTTPIPYPDKHVINVQFDVQVEELASNNITCFQEVHSMRYWFNDEIKAIADEIGLMFLEYYKWMTHDKPLPKDWYTVNILK